MPLFWGYYIVCLSPETIISEHKNMVGKQPKLLSVFDEVRQSLKSYMLVLGDGAA